MEFFPQLTTGTLAQYPVRKRIDTRTVFNTCLDGSRVALYDGAASTVRWELSYSGLSRAEADSISSLFQRAEGRLGTFTWLDPTGNLLAHSEDFTAPAWVREPLLQVTGGQPDAQGTNSAMSVVNTAQAPQVLSQQIMSPGSFSYTFSLHARSNEPVSVILRVHTTSLQEEHFIPVDTTWRRSEVVARLGAPEDLVAFAIEIPSGSSVDLFGAQVEPQPVAGLYKATFARSGVYANARFDQDELLSTAAGPDNYAMDVCLLAPLNE